MRQTLPLKAALGAYVRRRRLIDALLDSHGDD